MDYEPFYIKDFYRFSQFRGVGNVGVCVNMYYHATSFRTVKTEPESIWEMWRGERISDRFGPQTEKVGTRKFLQIKQGGMTGNGQKG